MIDFHVVPSSFHLLCSAPMCDFNPSLGEHDATTKQPPHGAPGNSQEGKTRTETVTPAPIATIFPPKATIDTSDWLEHDSLLVFNGT